MSVLVSAFPLRFDRLATVVVLVFGSLASSVTFAQDGPKRPVSMTMNEAIEIALENSYLLRNSQIDRIDVDKQVDEAFSGLYPTISLSSSYTRNVISPNPFSGSDAGSLFGGLGQLDWLAFNEEARTDDDPTTEPIALQAFRDRQQAGRDAAGIVLGGSDNPFAVPNQFQNSISLSQTLFNNAVFQAVKGVRTLKSATEAGIERQEQQVVNQTRVAFLQVLLIQEQAAVLEKSIARTEETVREAGRLVEQGIAPKFQRLTAEVELANIETQLISIRNQIELALNSLKMTIGLPIEQPISLLGSLQQIMPSGPGYEAMELQIALDEALEKRPDLVQAGLSIELQRINREVVRSGKLPIVSAFANVGLSGNVPSNRNSILSDANDPFLFTQKSNSFFSGSYWDPSFNMGIRLSWNIFDGLKTKTQIQRATLAIDRAELQELQLAQTVRSEVEQAMRNLKSARERINNQVLNVDRAALNYEFSTARLQEGVGSQLEERQASELLDQSSFAYVQAVFDYLIAVSNFEAALGAAPTDFLSR